MNKEKQIDEMGNIITEVAFVQAHEINGDENLADIVAEALYNAGYRKVEDYDNLKARLEVQETVIRDYQKKLKTNSKETAKEFVKFILGLFPIDKSFTTISKATIKAKLKEYGVEMEE